MYLAKLISPNLLISGAVYSQWQAFFPLEGGDEPHPICKN
jgi:hypothetical protein